MDFTQKYIKVISYHPLMKRYYKITYGYVKNDIIVEDPSNDMLLVGKFLSKNIDEKGKFEDGGYVNADGICYINKKDDCYREVDKEEYEQFRQEMINEVIEYGNHKIRE